MKKELTCKRASVSENKILLRDTNFSVVNYTTIIGFLKVICFEKWMLFYCLPTKLRRSIMSKVMQCDGGGAFAYILQHHPTFCHSITYTFILHQKFSSHQQSCLKREEKSFLNGWCWAAKLFKKHFSARHTTAEDKKNSFHTWGKEFTDRENFFYQQASWQFLFYTRLVYVHIVCDYVM